MYNVPAWDTSLRGVRGSIQINKQPTPLWNPLLLHAWQMGMLGCYSWALMSRCFLGTFVPIDVAGFEPTLTYIASKEDTRQLGGATSCKLACNRDCLSKQKPWDNSAV